MQKLLEGLKSWWYILSEVCRPGYSLEYRIFRLREAFGLPEQHSQHGMAGAFCGNPICFCEGPVAYNAFYDCHFCVASGVWMEKACNDPYCAFCSKRPPLAPTS